MLNSQTVQAWNSFSADERISRLSEAYASVSDRWEDCDDILSPCDLLSGGPDGLVDGLTRVFHAHECDSDRVRRGMSDPSEEGDSSDSFDSMADVRRETRGEYHETGSGNGNQETVNDYFDQKKFVKAIMRDWSHLLAE